MSEILTNVLNIDVWTLIWYILRTIVFMVLAIVVDVIIDLPFMSWLIRIGSTFSRKLGCRVPTDATYGFTFYVIVLAGLCATLSYQFI